LGKRKPWESPYEKVRLGIVGIKKAKGKKKKRRLRAGKEEGHRREKKKKKKKKKKRRGTVARL